MITGVFIVEVGKTGLASEPGAPSHSSDAIPQGNYL